jgi:hypothetical protein
MKGTMPRDFRLQIFFHVSLYPPLAPEYPITAVFRIFFENSQRYSQLKVQIEKILIRKVLNFLFEHLWIVKLT